MRPQRLSHCHRKGEARFWKGTYGRKRWPSPEALTAASVPGIPAAESKGKRRRKSPNRQVLQGLEGRQKQQGIRGRAGNTQDAEESPREESGCEKSRATHTWLGQAPPHRREGAGGTDGVKWPQGCQEQKAPRGNRNLQVLQTWAGCTGDGTSEKTWKPGAAPRHVPVFLALLVSLRPRILSFYASRLFSLTPFPQMPPKHLLQPLAGGRHVGSENIMLLG